MGFAWRWTLSPRTGAQGGAGKSSSLNSGWRIGGAELMVLRGIYWPAEWGAPTAVLEFPENSFLEILLYKMHLRLARLLATHLCGG